MVGVIRNIILLCCLTITLWVGAQGYGEYQSHVWSNNTLVIQTELGQLTIVPRLDNMVQIDFAPEGEIRENLSNAVILQGAYEGDVTFRKGNQLELSWGNMSLKVRKRDGRVRFYRDGSKITTDEGYYQTDSTEAFTFKLRNREHLYGGGFRALPMDRRGHRLPLYNYPQYGYEMGWEGSNFSIPLIYSSEKYGIYFDNVQKGWLDLGKTDAKSLQTEFIGGPLTYYFFTNDAWPELVQTYSKLTGTQPLPPRWALGNFASRFGYENEEEAREVVNLFREDSIPLDAVIIDLYWFGEGVHDSFYMGDLEWYEKSWPNHDQMIVDFILQKVKTVLITEPFIMKESRNFEYCVKNGLLATDSAGDPYVIEDFRFGKTGLLDIFKPESRDWFWQQYDKQIQKGLRGWWGNVGEPEKHPSAIRHVNGPADEVHNLYGHWWSKMLWDRYQSHYPVMRLFHLNRAGFAGSQRYSIYPRSGDVHRNWGGFRAQIPIMLGMGMCGIPFIHSDLGGFAMGKRDPDLYLRWLQMGVFNPIFRPHAGRDIPSEPVYWDDTTKAIAREAIRLRYRMMPYNYKLAHETNETGMPLVRPVFFYDDDKDFADWHHTYFWGPDILVGPVMDSGIVAMDIQLPAGNWYDFYTDEPYEGDQTINYSVKREYTPAFARAGSIIPMKPTFYNTYDYPDRAFTLKAYAIPGGGTLKTTFYEDDGKMPSNSASYKREEIRVEIGHGSGADNPVSIKIKAEGGYDPVARVYTVELIGLESRPSALMVNGEEGNVIDSGSEGIADDGPMGIWNDETGVFIIEVVE